MNGMDLWKSKSKSKIKIKTRQIKISTIVVVLGYSTVQWQSARTSFAKRLGECVRARALLGWLGWWYRSNISLPAIWFAIWWGKVPFRGG